MAAGSRLAATLAYADLATLAVALPVFVAARLPIAGYLVTAAAWLAGRALRIAAERRGARAMTAGDRRSALGGLAAATLGRVWILAGAILAVGLIEREAGLAAAVLAAAVVTVHLASQAIIHLLAAPEERR